MQKHTLCISERLRASGSGASSERNKEMGSPFVHTAHGNPAFTPQKAGKTSSNTVCFMS